MNKDELKKKIVKILANCKCEECAIEYCADCEGNPSIEHCREKQQADALIAAGIGDVSELRNHRVVAEYSLIPEDGNSYVLPNTPLRVKQLYSGEEVEKIVKERDEYKHRAEVAERAGRIIQRDMARVFDVSNPRVCELIVNIWDLAKKQAEKELAEERKDD